MRLSHSAMHAHYRRMPRAARRVWRGRGASAQLARRPCAVAARVLPATRPERGRHTFAAGAEHGPGVSHMADAEARLSVEKRCGGCATQVAVSCVRPLSVRIAEALHCTATSPSQAGSRPGRLAPAMLLGVPS